MMPYWNRRPDLDAEIQSLMGRSDVEVFDDTVHECLHLFIGGAEFSSCQFPLNDQVRDDLRQQAFLLHNGLDEAERQRIREANIIRAAADANTVEEAKADWREYGVWEYKHRFEGSQVTPMFIVPEAK